MTVYVERPWVDYFDKIKTSNDKLDAQCKLIRNQIASLDLGNPHFKLFDSYHKVNKHAMRGEPRERPDSRTLYLEWVADWKQTYRKLSETIRALKVGFKNAQRSNDASEQNRAFVALTALRRSAQVMLNARYNAKLASAELRRRRLALEGEAAKLAA
jgi:hypothetical protein